MISSSHHWQIAERILTPRQLEALQLYDRGLSYRTIGLHLNVSNQRAAQLVNRATRLIDLELRKDPAA